ncbi:MAG TPA: putative quinol monooxygenase [Candidatus Limnocylindrales bacterium]|nr:putative quinol monooxygenase [Candidatus Limnocylindrales bacterium]
MHESAATQSDVVVRIAEIEVDPAHRPSFISAVKEEMEEAVRVEPGVLAIYAVAEKDNPSRLRFFEIYANDEAYRAHRESPHFRKYVEITGPMILTRELIETIPIQLSSKAR